MDWIEEKIEKYRSWLSNLSFRKAMVGYILTLAVLVFILSNITIMFCYRWERLIWMEQNGTNQIDARILEWSVWSGGDAFVMFMAGMDKSQEIILRVLDTVRVWCPFIYGFSGMVLVICIFYRNRLKKPFEILKKGTEEIAKSNLDFPMHYDSQDEMGKLCDSFELMREELIHNKNEMWELIESQKRLNAAFAHDLRTPLTVLKGYSDFLARYIPEGKVGEAKTLETLKLMSAHLERLEQFSRTMKGIRSIEEMPMEKEASSYSQIKKDIEEVIFALNQIGDIRIELQKDEDILDKHIIFVDKNMILEVLENLLSNAIRFAVYSIQVRIFLSADEQELILSVKDDGEGFAPDEMDKMLLPYEKEQSKDKEHFGIGLHICRLLCQKHGGTISVANSMTGGALVTASFFCKDEPIHKAIKNY